MNCQENPNYLWSRLIVRTLVNCGVEHFYVSPGYRNVPIIATLQRFPSVQSFSCVDERAAGFRALGCARAVLKPVVLVCTSGTAVANYFPAVIEAFKENIPLIVLSCDRPFALVKGGANQAIEQGAIFGQFVNASVQLPTPTHDIDPKVLISEVLSLWEKSCFNPVGPVHINLPLEEPLEPPPFCGESENVLTNGASEKSVVLNSEGYEVSSNRWNFLVSGIKEAKRGMFIVGRIPSSCEALVSELLKKWDWPVYFDVLATKLLPAHFNRSVVSLDDVYGQKLIESYDPDCIIHLGYRLVSKHFDMMLAKKKPNFYAICSPSRDLQDISFSVDLRLRGDFVSIVQNLMNLPMKSPPSEAEKLRACTDEYRKHREKGTGEGFTFDDVVEPILDSFPRDSLLMLGNSMTIRVFDRWLKYNNVRSEVEIFANRGVSGIEGIIATTVGLSEGRKCSATVVLGDVSCIHDLNSILLLSQLNYPITVIVVNNSGGGIFRTLPLKEFPHVLNPLVTTPHSFSFSGISEMAGVVYHQVRSSDSLKNVYRSTTESKKPSLIECLISDEFAVKIKN